MKLSGTLNIPGYNIEAALKLARPVGIHLTGSDGYHERATQHRPTKRERAEDDAVGKMIERVTEMK